MTGGGHQGTSMTKLKRSQSLADGVDKPIGYGFLHLNPHYSWINDTERVQYRDLFRLKSHEELRRIEEAKNAELASLDRKDKDTGYYRNESDKVRKRRRNKGWQGSKRRANKDEVELEYIETEIDAYFGIDMEQNYKELPMQYFNSVESDSLFPSRFRATKKKENLMPDETLFSRGNTNLCKKAQRPSPKMQKRSRCRGSWKSLCGNQR